LGKAACATRAVSSGTGPTGAGCSAMIVLLYSSMRRYSARPSVYDRIFDVLQDVRLIWYADFPNKVIRNRKVPEHPLSRCISRSDDFSDRLLVVLPTG
jgi:hypothetical protein